MIAHITLMPFKLRALVVFLAGSLLALAMPPLALWPVLFLSFSTFYILLSGQGGWRAFGLGWLFGFGFFLFGLYWIGNALLVPGNPYKWVWPLTIAGLPVGLAFFTAAAAYVAARLSRAGTWAGYAAFVAAIMLSEWLRGHVFSGFPWNLYGYAWARSLAMTQTVSVIGTYGLSALSVAWATLPGFLLLARPGRRTISLALFALITTLNLCWFLGAQRLESSVPVHDGIILRIVQPNIAQEDKWRGDKIGDNLRATIAQSVAPKKPGAITVTIWPETALTDDVVANRDGAELLRRSLFAGGPGDLLMSGVLRHGVAKNGEPLYFNSLVTYDSGLRALSVYDKSHLVPFGEYIPLRDYIPLHPFVNFSGFTPGHGLVTQNAANIPPFSGLVCYEVIFPGAVTAPQHDAEWMVNVTNDGWYGDSAGPYQHLIKTAFRAAEEGRPLARSANTGISALIDPYGRIVARLPYGTAGYIDHPLPRALTGQTWFSRFGDIPLLLVLSGLIVWAFFMSRRAKTAA